jgi:hypothetical protein
VREEVDEQGEGAVRVLEMHVVVHAGEAANRPPFPLEGVCEGVGEGELEARVEKDGLAWSVG